MAQLSSAMNASRPLSEREALVALISRLSLASADVEARATRLTAAASDVSDLAAEVQAQVAYLLPPPPPPEPDVSWIAGVPKTPTQIEHDIPEGSGEVWYVVIRGREPGLYRTHDEANAQTNGVPNQWQQKKRSRREAIAWYRDHYVAARNAANAGEVPSAPPVGVQKWVAVVSSTV